MAAVVALVALAAACTSSPLAPPDRGPTASPLANGAAYAAALRSTLSGLVDSMKVPSAVVLVRSPTFGDATFTFGTVKLGENNAPDCE